MSRSPRARTERASAITRSGRVRGRPRPPRGTRTASRTTSKTVESLTLPGVRTTDSGRPRPSTARWTLVVSPPRDRPRACRAAGRRGSSSSPVSSPPGSPFCGRRQHAGGPGYRWSPPTPSTPQHRPRHRGPGGRAGVQVEGWSARALGGRSGSVACEPPCSGGMGGALLASGGGFRAPSRSGVA
jgi:hypothetical protein